MNAVPHRQARAWGLHFDNKGKFHEGFAIWTGGGSKGAPCVRTGDFALGGPGSVWRIQPDRRDLRASQARLGDRVADGSVCSTTGATEQGRESGTTRQLAGS